MRITFFIAVLSLYANAFAITPYAVMDSVDLWLQRDETLIGSERLGDVRRVLERARTCGPQWKAAAEIGITSGSLVASASPEDERRFADRARVLRDLALTYGFAEWKVRAVIDPNGRHVSDEMRRKASTHEHYVRLFLYCAPHT